MESEDRKEAFPGTDLLDWYDRVKRDLPWRNTNDPYRVWISEVVLQQTRVDQGLPYYERFVAAFPTVNDLANAPEDAVLKAWEGLGYYSRARNLHFTAKVVANELNREFPDSYEGLLKLKGIGPYTAAAIASIVFGRAVAAVDGNVYRVMARYFGISDSIDEGATRSRIGALASSVVSQRRPGDHNQAVMELGATVCSPIAPKCGECPLKLSCRSFQGQLQDEIPVRTKKSKVRDRFFHYLVKTSGNEILLAKRQGGDIWQGLYEFPLIESERRLKDPEAVARFDLNPKDVVLSVSSEFKHVLSHQRIFAKFIHVETIDLGMDDFLKVKTDKLSSFAFPRLINRYLDKQSLVIEKEV